jgi:hypothetical protein
MSAQAANQVFRTGLEHICQVQDGAEGDVLLASLADGEDPRRSCAATLRDGAINSFGPVVPPR